MYRGPGLEGFAFAHLNLYVTARQWWDADGVGETVEVVFDYQQAATGSRVKRETRGFAADATRYAPGGRRGCESTCGRAQQRDSPTS